MISMKLERCIYNTTRYTFIMPAQVQDKHGNTLAEGDYVWTKYRGGSHQGQVRHFDATLVMASSDRD